MIFRFKQGVLNVMAPMIRPFVWLLTAIFLFAGFAGQSFASRVIDAATVDGLASVNVAAGASISAAVTVTTVRTGGNGSDNWGSTGWRIATASGSLTCVDHQNLTTAGTATRTFNITAPAVDGTYNVYFVAYQNNFCGGGQPPSAEFVLPNAVVVGSTTPCPDDSSYPQIFSDDFSDGNRNGWTPIEFDYAISNYQGETVADVGQTSDTEWNTDWTVFNGDLWWNRGGGAGSADEYGMLSYDLSGSYDTSAISEYSIKANVNGYPTNQNNDVGIVFGYVDDSNYYILRWTKIGDYYATNPGGYPGSFRRLTLARVSSGTAERLEYFDGFYDGGEFELKVTVRPDGIHACIDGNSIFSYTGSGRPALNRFGLYTFDNDDGVSFDDIEVRAITYQCFTDGFDRAALGADWAVSSSGGSFGNPRIVNGRLRLTDSSSGVATAASLLRLFPGAGNEIVYEFDHFSYDGTGADGIAITLSDAAVAPVPGGYGGSLGYAQRCGIDGFAGGWLGVGIDEFGNFRNDDECRGDGGAPTGRVQDSVSVRGSGSAQTGYLLHGESGTLTPAIDNPGSATAAYGHRYRITVDHTDSTHAYVTLERDTGSGYQTIIPTYDAAAQSGQAVVPLNWLLSLTASTGVFRNIHEVDDLRVCATSVLPYAGIDHYRFYHDGAAITCAPEDIQVRACLDADCTVEFAGAIDATLSPGGWVGGDSQSFLSGDSLQLWHTSAESVTLDIAGNSSEAVAVKPPRCFIGATEQADCSLVFSDSGFVFAVPDLTACQPSSTVTIQAVSTDATTQTCAANSRFANTSTDVNFWSSYSNPASGTEQVSLSGAAIATSSPGTGISLSFDATSTAGFTVNYPDAGELLLSAQYAGAVGAADEGLVLFGNDSFVARPVGLCVESNDADADCATGASCSMFRTVDQNFNLNVRAVCWESAGDIDFCSGNQTTPNYEQGDIPITHNLVAPVGGSPGAIVETLVSLVAADSGNHLISNQSVSEVGVFTFTATPPDYFGQPLPPATSSNIGRFIPHHFTVTANTPLFNEGCLAGAEDFTYLGQEFGYLIDPVWTVTAVNAANVPTNNYGDAFWKLNSTLFNRSHADASGLASVTVATDGSVTLGEAGDYDGDGELTLAGARLAYTRPATELAPFDTSIDLIVPASNLQDGDGVCYDAEPDGVCDSFTISAIGDTEQRYGQLVLQNAYGPETLPLTLTLFAEYFNGSSYIVNGDDSCTNYTIGNLMIDDGEADQLDAAETSAADTDLINNVFINGVGRDFQLAAPTTGDSGSIGLLYDLDLAGLSWLKPLDATGTPQNPVAKATFGIFKGNERLIYLRESVQ